MRAHSLVVAAVFAAGSFQYSSPARACSPANCPPLVVPAATQLPGNMAYFLSIDSSSEITMQTAAGEVIPASVRIVGTERVFAPEAPIAEGTEVVLTYQDACASPMAPSTFAFTAGPHEQLALRAAGLSVVEQGRRRADVTGYDTAFVKVRYTSPNPNAAIVPILRHTASLDGEWIRNNSGEGEWEFEIKASCHPNAHPLGGSCGGVSNVAPGLRALMVQTTVLGAETQPEPVSLQIDLRCPSTEESRDGGDDIIEDEVAVDGTLSSAEDDAAGTVQDVVSGSGASTDAGAGCSLEGRAGAGSWGWAAAALLLGSVLLRRRRH